jgi:hypothetical protein
MLRSASRLAPTQEGGFIACKVIPVGVRAEYAKQYGQRTEERLNTGPMPILLARAKHREWSSEIEARFANLRAARSGEGRTLTPKEARALAGEWYGWFTGRMAASNWPPDVWDDYQWQVRSELYGPAMAGGGTPSTSGSGTVACATACVQLSPMRPSPTNSWRRSAAWRPNLISWTHASRR